MTPPISALLNFANQVVVVTGAGNSGGIGAGIATRFAEAGAHVVVHYRSSLAQANAITDQINKTGTAVAAQADLSTPEGAAQLFAQSVAAFGHVDVLVNNAGIYPLHSLLEMDVADWDAVLNTNLRSALLCTQAFAKQVIAQNTAGAIVNITSIEASNPAPMHSHYNASKAALEMLTKSSANELGAFGIRVNAVAPGLIWREGIEQHWADGVQRWQRAAPLKRLGLPEDIADACLFLASPMSRWVTGASLTVDGGVMTRQIF